MAARGHDRCGALCQHPGCWKSTKKVYSTPKDYLLKMERTKNLTERDLSNSETRSYTKDGLPTLKINTLECAAIKKKKSAKYSHSLLLPTGSSISHPQLHNPKGIHYIQLLLEEDDSYAENGEITYAPVLLWNPNGQKKFPVKVSPGNIPSQCPQVESSHLPLSDGSTKLDTSLGRRSSLSMPRTDLTNTLPPTIDSLKLKEAQVERMKTLQTLAFGGAESLSCLNDVDLPLPVLDEIIHQLRSESSMSLIGSPRNTPPATHQISRVHRSLHETSHTPRISSRMQRTIYNISASRITRAAERSSPHRIESFSRQLSMKPQETLQRFYAPTRKLEGANGRPSQFDMDGILSQVNDISALNHSHQLHIRSSKVAEDLTDLLPYSRRTTIERNGLVVIPRARKGLASVYPINSTERSMEMSRKPGYRPAFKHSPFKQRLLSSANSCFDFSEESSLINEATMKFPADTSIPRPPRNSCCNSSIPSLPQSQATQNLATPVSPDYMMMTAKLSSGKLILTDRRKGLTFVRKITMSDTELNADSECNLEHNFLPSPVQELKDENSSRHELSGACSDMEVDDDVFEDMEKKEEIYTMEDATSNSVWEKNSTSVQCITIDGKGGGNITKEH